MKKTKEIELSPLFDQILDETPLEAKLYVSKSLQIANQIIAIMERKNMMQKDLAAKLGKSEAEISKWLSGFHNFTLKSIVKIEAELGEEIIITPKQFVNNISEVLKSFASNLNQKIKINTSFVGIKSVETNIPAATVTKSAKMIQFQPLHLKVKPVTQRPLTGTYS